jgi:hypothetical protein
MAVAISWCILEEWGIMAWIPSSTVVYGTCFFFLFPSNMTDGRRDNVLLGSKSLVLGGGCQKVTLSHWCVNISRFRQLTRDTPPQGLGMALYRLYSVTEWDTGLNGSTLLKWSMEKQSTEVRKGINWLIIHRKCVFVSTRLCAFTIHKCW